MATLWKVLTRKKVLDADTGTPLARVLNTFDLTALGVGSTLGVGVYVLAGQVAKNTAGPAVVLSFLIAAIASVFAGLCYAEFGARTPKAGSAYIYSYVCVGEFIAFVIGWNLILEYIIGSASVAKGLSSYVDNLCNGSLSRTFTELLPIDIPYLSPYFDVFAFTVPILLSIALAFGMKESSLINNIFTTCNIGVVLFVIVAGAMNAHWSNWFINPNDVKNVTNSTNIGHGGFFPFGIQGVIKGAATCFYGFVGFDCIATTGEEVKNPKKAIPIAIISSLLIIFLAYFGTSTVLTLMVPYYEQDATAPIPAAFQAVHWYTAAYIVTFGAMFGLYASLFGAMFPLPRILYAMASDGLIFKCLGKVNQRFRTPVLGTLLAGIFTGTMGAVFNLESLVDMMSIGTLLAYTIVAACVLLLRYSVDEKEYMPIPGCSDSEEDGYVQNYDNVEPTDASEDTALNDTTEESTSAMKQIFNFGKIKFPNKISQTIVTVDICLFCVLCFLLGLCALNLQHEIANREVIPLSGVAVILILMALTMFSIASQPVSRTTLSFQVPWVPLIPALSILCNIYLMIMLDIATWIRFVVWMTIGVPTFYFTRRCTSKIDENDTNINTQGYVNNGFYGDNLVYSNGGEVNQGTLVIEEKIFAPLKIVDNSIESIQTPSPSRVIESLDFVIDSFVDDSTAPFVMSASSSHSALVLSNKPRNGDFRDTPNSALRSELLNGLKEDIGVPNFENVLNQDEVGSDLMNKYNASSEGIENDENSGSNSPAFHEFDKDSSSPSEKSYISASSTIITDPIDYDIEKTIAQSCHLNPSPQLPPPSPPPLPPPTPPPPPPPLEDYINFSRKKIDPNIEVENIQKSASKSLERLVKNKKAPLIITKNSLSSVKLRHVHRPSIERSSSVEIQKRENEMSGEEHLVKKTIPKVDDEIKSSVIANSLPLVNLRHVKRPSLEIKNENVDTTQSQNSPENSRPSRYFKSKSTNDLEKRNYTNKNDNSFDTRKKMGISKDAINSVKLKPVVRPTLTLHQEPKTDLPDSVKFGSSEFNEFKEQLNEKLKKPIKILREPSFVDPKAVPKKGNIQINRENVIDDNLDWNKAKATIETEINNKLIILNSLEKHEDPN